MLPRLAQAIESLFGEALRPAAGLLRAAALVALVAAVTFSLVRAARALRAFRLGWENVLVVRCPAAGAWSLTRTSGRARPGTRSDSRPARRAGSPVASGFTASPAWSPPRRLPFPR